MKKLILIGIFSGLIGVSYANPPAEECKLPERKKNSSQMDWDPRSRQREDMQTDCFGDLTEPEIIKEVGNELFSIGDSYCTLNQEYFEGYMKKACEMNNREACMRYADTLNGQKKCPNSLPLEGVKLYPISSKSVAYYEKAAELGNPHAQFLVGIRPFQNLDKSKLYLEKAANNGYADAMYMLAKIFHIEEKEDTRDEHFTQEGIEILHKAAELDQADALYELSEYYQKTDEKKSKEYLKRSADLGVGAAMIKYAQLYEKNTNFDEYLSLVKRAADIGFNAAFYELLSYPQVSQSTLVSIIESDVACRFISNKGNDYRDIPDVYYLDPDYIQEAFKRLIKYESHEAMIELIRINYDGERGFPIDREEAKKWFYVLKSSQKILNKDEDGLWKKSRRYDYMPGRIIRHSFINTCKLNGDK